MISVLASTGKYILQPSLVEMHQQSVAKLSAFDLYKKELAFFQKILDQNSTKKSDVAFKQRVSHFQNLITYYDGEVVDLLAKKIRHHEQHLANMLQLLNETDTEYFKEHHEVIEEASTFEKVFVDFKHEFYAFMEHLVDH